MSGLNFILFTSLVVNVILLSSLVAKGYLVFKSIVVNGTGVPWGVESPILSGFDSSIFAVAFWFSSHAFKAIRLSDEHICT